MTKFDGVEEDGDEVEGPMWLQAGAMGPHGPPRRGAHGGPWVPAVGVLGPVVALLGLFWPGPPQKPEPYIGTWSI